MSLTDYESELVVEWLNKMLKCEGKYLEPILDLQSTVLMKDVCSMLKQDVHVFTFSVDTLEDYISKKSALSQEIPDPVLALVCTIFVCSKYIGEQDIKIKHLTIVLKKLTGQIYDPTAIKSAEVEILSTLNNNLPINNNVEDLKTFVAKFERECPIKVSIIPLCVEIMEMLYLTRKEWFYSLKELYVNTKEALRVFNKLIRSRFYLPIGILIYAFRNTTYSKTLSVNNMLEDFAKGSQIHVDHLNALCTKCQNDGTLYTSSVLRTNSSRILEYNNNRYYFFTEVALNFYSAFQFCKLRNMELLSIESAEENTKIGLHLVEKGWAGRRFWTSAVNMGVNKKWFWLSTGQELKYFNWDKGEPTGESVPFVANYENCIQARHEGNRGFTWNDLNCFQWNNVICEAPVTCSCKAPRISLPEF
ncbi:unnamed protein product [Phyllotreta striolata]|uniref:C-type lectin domain-containing protein n=1 Tax=Phyllotreta striolata TaxID=444603 RepID=A0A9N9TJ27_PHYSR|nr:unnamed protein product [Phyllotreta striolata]